MKTPGSMLLAMALGMVPLAAQERRFDDRNWKVDEKETIRKTFDLSSGSGDKRLLVDNISGAIRVTGYSGSQVQVAVEKHIYAYSNEAMQEAKRDVKLDMSQQGNYARLYVDGPFRTSNGMNYRGDQYYGYRVVFDYDIQVPYDTELILKTMNNGEIVVKKTTADYEISGLNGGIEMDEVSGSGKINTLNGKLKVTYTKNPAKATSFHTLNGSIDVYFQPALNADLSFQRLNGAIYSDFEVSSRPTSVSGSLTEGKFIYRGNQSVDGRAGSGGPPLSFHTLNGVIRLHSKSF